MPVIISGMASQSVIYGFCSPTRTLYARGDAMGQIVTDNVSFENQIHQFFQNQRIGKLLKHSNISKEKGISPVAVFRMLFTRDPGI
jgi:hypothetical protein